jgi:hypothetical protein
VNGRRQIYGAVAVDDELKTHGIGAQGLKKAAEAE